MPWEEVSIIDRKEEFVGFLAYGAQEFGAPQARNPTTTPFGRRPLPGKALSYSHIFAFAMDHQRRGLNSPSSLFRRNGEVASQARRARR